MFICVHCSIFQISSRSVCLYTVHSIQGSGHYQIWFQRGVYPFGEEPMQNTESRSQRHMYSLTMLQKRGMLQKLHCQEAVTFACVSAMVLVFRLLHLQCQQCEKDWAQSMLNTKVSSNTNHHKLQILYYIHFLFLGRSQGYFSKSTPTKKPMVKPTQQATKVEWFVSHWWGTSVATYCSALRRHAYEVKVGMSSSNSGGFGKVTPGPGN